MTASGLRVWPFHVLLLSPPVAQAWQAQHPAHTPPLFWCVRAAEYEADAIGIHLLAKACYDPDANISMLQKLNKVQEAQGMQQPELLSTHPLTEVRSQAIRHADRLRMGGATLTASSADLRTCSSLVCHVVSMLCCVMLWLALSGLNKGLAAAHVSYQGHMSEWHTFASPAWIERSCSVYQGRNLHCRAVISKELAEPARRSRGFSGRLTFAHSGTCIPH